METFNIGPLHTNENGLPIEYQFKLLGGGPDSSIYDIERITEDDSEIRRCRIQHNEIALCREYPDVIWKIAEMNAQGKYLVTARINKKNTKDITVINNFLIRTYSNIGAYRIFKLDDDHENLYMFLWQPENDKITADQRKSINKALRLYNKLTKLVQVKKPRKRKESVI